MDKIRHHLVLITGASSGIGEATAKFFAKRNATLVLLARNEQNLIKVSDKIIKNGGKAYYFPVDLSDWEQTYSIANRIKKTIGIPNIIINNAGTGRWLNVEETPPAEAQNMIALPYLAAFYITKAFLTEMKERNSGHIVNLTSDASYLPKGNAVAYSASRFALRGFSESLKSSLIESEIKVSLAVFGKVKSSYWKNNPESEKRVPKRLPFMPELSTFEVAEYIAQIVDRGKDIIIRPQIFKFLFWMHRKWPKHLAISMKR